MLSFVGILLSLLGLTISIAFWIPKIFDRKKAKELLASRYPVVYFIYLANGPLLFFLGLFLWLRFR